LSFLGRPVFFEAHDAPRRLLRLWSFMLKKMTGIISQNKWKVDFFHKRLGVGISKIFAYPNGFDPRDFSHIVSKDWAREQLNLPRNVLIILYAGHLYSWKGADTLLKTARRFSEEKSPIPGLFRNNLLFIFVGGTEEDIGRFRKESADLKNVMVAGRRPHREIPLWLFSADILVLPNSAKSEESVWATSPIKLFEYMAAGRPIIASDLPSIRENVSEKEVLFVRPDDPEAIKNGILKIISDPDRARRLAENSKIKSAEFTWQNRAEAILNWINKVV
jgi:glycosyltransferase involved in cell wall biosynthesis